MAIKRTQIVTGATFLVLFTHLTLPVNLANIAIGIFALSALIDKEIVKKLNQLLQTQLFWISLIPFLLFSISALYSSDSGQAIKQTEIRLPLLLFPLIFGLVPLSKKQTNGVLHFFIGLIAALPVIGFLIQIPVFQETQDSGYFYNDNLIQFISKQAAYYGLYINLAMVGLFYFWQQKGKQNTLLKASYIAAFILLVTTQYLLASRMAMVISLLIIASMAVIQFVTHTSRKQLFAVIVVFVLGIVGLTLFFPKVLKRFESIRHLEYQFDNTNPINHFNGEIKAENWNGLNTRLALWECALEVVKEKPLLGTGIGDVQDDLVKKYTEKNFIFAIESNYNSHNQYIDILLSNGIVGLFGFLIFVGYIVKLAVSHRNYLLIGIMIVLLLSFFTENVLSRNQGVMITGLMLFMVLNSVQLKNNKI